MSLLATKPNSLGTDGGGGGSGGDDDDDDDNNSLFLVKRIFK